MIATSSTTHLCLIFWSRWIVTTAIADVYHTLGHRGFVSHHPSSRMCLLTGATTRCKDEKWTGLLSRSSLNHKLTAGVKKYSGHGDSFEEVTVSTLFIYTCPVCVTSGAPRNQPPPLFIFTYLIT